MNLYSRIARAGFVSVAILSIVACNPSKLSSPLRVQQAGTRTSESGGQAKFTAALVSKPSADATMSMFVSDITEGKLVASSLKFTVDNWNAPQTVVVTGVDDLVQDGAKVYQVRFGAIVSQDGDYSGVTPGPVTFTNEDNDTAGVTVSEASSDTSEAGAQAIFSVVLNSKPTADVTFNFDSSNPGEGTVGAKSLTFTQDNWSSTQSVTVTGVDDEVADGKQAYSILFSPTQSSDATYAALTPSTVALFNDDNDTAAIIVSNIDIDTGEDGTQAHFSVTLNSRPTSNVTLTFDSNNPGEGTVANKQLVLTPANWDAPQIVTVTGVNDDAADGNQLYAVVFAPSLSADLSYQGIKPADLPVTNRDNDSAGITVSPISGNTSEGGAQATFKVVLNTQPSANVTVHFASSNTGEGTLSSGLLTFTSLNWKSLQTVTVTGVNDDVADGNQPYAITFSSTTSTDADYAALTPANVSVINTDNDSAGITVSAIDNDTTEGGGQASFTVVLNSKPKGDVKVSFDSNKTTEGTVAPKSLTFTAVNWKSAQSATVTGVNDDVADGNQLYSIIFTPTVSTDAAYAAILPGTVAVRNLDDDSPGISVSALNAHTTEGGGQASFTVVLDSQPKAAVTVSFDSNNTAEGTTAVNALTFTTANWKSAQTVDVTGVNDDVADGDQSYAIVFSATTSTDAAYAAITPGNVSALNDDDDSATITVSAVDGKTAEWGLEAGFTVVLDSMPTGDVVVHFDSNDATEGLVALKALTFTTSNWSSPQTAKVTGVNDDEADGDQTYAVVFTATTGADAKYNAVTPGDVTVENIDDDQAGFSIGAISGHTSESGAQATFSVALTSKPTGGASVTLNYHSTNILEGTLVASALTFGQGDWNVPQNVVVTGANDAVADGPQNYAIAFDATTSGDVAYAAILPANVGVTNDDDNDLAGITVGPISGDTGEDGTSATFTVALNSQPTSDVSVNFDSNDITEGTVGPQTLTFTSVNWATAQTAIVSGVDDAILDGDQTYAIVFSATSSSDPAYAAITPANIVVKNLDNEVAP